jgi:hypothetical protein
MPYTYYRPSNVLRLISFRKELEAFSCFEALTDLFFVVFHHELPVPSIRRETRTRLNVLY